MENRFSGEKQMTTAHAVGAPSALLPSWEAINWQKAKSIVKRLQMRIAKAIQQGRYNKAKALQWLLTHSFYAKALAIKRVTENRGKHTAGIDGKLWKTPKQKMQAINQLKQRGYQAQPLRRIYIPKKKGHRPLGIPVMIDRAQQALHLLALIPVAETTADKNSYGFRPHRCCADAIEQCFRALSMKASAQYVLEADIRSCFDEISHPWLQQHILMNKKLLNQWLKSGYIFKQLRYDTESGTPQGGIISPTLMNLTLDGMEQLIKSMTKQSDKVHFIRYADDFVITGSSYEFLRNKIKPAIQVFLAERGLSLSEEKTKITHINDGFDFLGFNLRKYSGKLLIKPNKESIKSLLSKIRKLIRNHRSSKTANMLRQLNPIIRGWCNYYKGAVAKKIFSYIDSEVFYAIWKWCKRRHPNKSAGWVKRKYFRRKGNRNWVFFAAFQATNGNRKSFDLFSASYTPIKRHLKVKGAANPFDKSNQKYFEQRLSRKTKEDYLEKNSWVEISAL